MVQRAIPVKDVKAGDKYDADVGDILELLTGVGEVSREDRAVVANAALMVCVIRFLYLDVHFAPIPKDTFGVKDHGSSLRICPGILGCQQKPAVKHSIPFFSGYSI